MAVPVSLLIVLLVPLTGSAADPTTESSDHAERAQGRANGAPPDSAAATEVTGSGLRQVVIDGVPILVIDEVRITQQGSVITGDVGRYDRQAERAVVEGHVRVVDGGTTITGDHGTFETDSGVAVLTGDVEIARDDLRIRGPRATYDRTSGILEVGGGVTVIDATRRVDADSLVYWAEEDRAMAFGDVRIDEKGEETAMRGEVAEYRRQAGDLHLLERASLVLEEDGEPVEVTAEDLQFQNEGRNVVAEGNVVVRQEGAEATSERAVFRRDDRWAMLTGSPVARGRYGEARGDTLEMHFEQGELKRLTTRGHANSFYGQDEPGGGREEIWLRGESMVVELEDGEAREVITSGSAESVYFPGSSRSESGALRNDARADRIRVTMATGRPERVIFEGGAEGEYFYLKPAEKDTLGLGADSTAAGDSAAVLDSLAVAVGDSLAVPAGDSLAAVAVGDTLAAAAIDSLAAAAVDSLAAAAIDSLAAAAIDSLAAAAIDTLAAAVGDSTATTGSRADRVFAGLERSLPADSLVGSVRYKAERIDFLVERNEILLRRRAELYHETLHLTAGEVRFDAAERTLIATEEPVLEDASQKMDGSVMTYDFPTREGRVLEGGTTFDQGFYTGNRLYRAGDGSLHVKNAAYTTCNLEPPHYHFAGYQMKIYLDDKVVTRPLGLFIRRVPILGLPFYIFPIKRGRHSGFLMPQLEFGFSDRRGRFIHNAGYYWVVNDYADLKGWADISEFSPYFIGNLDLRYRQRYRLDGEFLFKFTMGEQQKRRDIRGTHRQDLGSRQTLRVNADWVSDRAFRRDDQGQFTQDRLNTQLRSNLAYTKNWETQSIQLTAEATQNLQNVAGETEEGRGTVTGSLPSIAYSFRGRPIGRAPDAKGRGGRWPFLASTVYSFSMNYRRSLDTRREPDIYLQTASGRASISDRRRIGVLNLGPRFSVSSSWDERLEQTDPDGVIRPGLGHIFRGSYTTGMDVQTELYGFFAPSIGPYRGFRHILTPRAAASYAQNFDSQADVEGGPGTGTLSLALDNRFETRLPDGDNLRPVRDFLVVNLNTSYDLSNRLERRFAPINLRALLRPGFGRDFQIDYSATYDPYERRTTRYSTSTRFSFTRSGRAAGERTGAGPGDEPGGGDELGMGEGARDELPTGSGEGPETGSELGDLFPHAFNLGGTLSFAGGGGSNRSLQGAFTSNLRLTPKWRFDYQLRYDILERQVVGQSYTIVRDLHCWQAQFRRSFDLGSWEYYFRIAIKDLPEIFYERGRDRSTLPSFP